MVARYVFEDGAKDLTTSTLYQNTEILKKPFKFCALSLKKCNIICAWKFFCIFSVFVHVFVFLSLCMLKWQQ